MRKISNVNARGAVSTSTEHKFHWRWSIKDLSSVIQNGRKVFSCFSCGGGSSMGYKLAGYEVIGNCEIDDEIYLMYKKNHHPRYSYHMDVRDFLQRKDLPKELYDLDILDGSPPCSVFSTAGSREKAWGKEKTFREGQKKQTLDDLFFTFISIAEKLRPKVVIAENVTGLLKGNAKGYVTDIIKAFHSAGYEPQIFQLNAAEMGVPQKRERVFFIARRKDLQLNKLNMDFSESPIVFGEVRTKKRGREAGPVYGSLLKHMLPTDKSIADISLRVRKRESGFTNAINQDGDVAFTIVSSGCQYRGCDGTYMTDLDFIHCQTFPEDYDFCGQSVQYVCGMSVPPVMMAQIASQIHEQWFSVYVKELEGGARCPEEHTPTASPT